MLDKIFVDIYTDDKRQCIGAGDLKFISKSSKVWRKEKEGSRWQFCFNGIGLPIWLSEEKLIFGYSYPDKKKIINVSIYLFDLDKKHDIYRLCYDTFKNKDENEYICADSFIFWLKVKNNVTKDIIRKCRITDIDNIGSMKNFKNYILDPDITISSKDGSVRFNF